MTNQATENPRVTIAREALAEFERLDVGELSIYQMAEQLGSLAMSLKPALGQIDFQEWGCPASPTVARQPEWAT